MTSGAGDPSSLLSYATTNGPLGSLAETRGAEVTDLDRGSQQLSPQADPLRASGR